MSTSSTIGTGLRRGQRVLLSAAIVVSVVLLIGAAVFPAYQSTIALADGSVIDGSKTLLEVNGPGVLVTAAVPLLASVVVGWALWRRRGRDGAGAIAWTVTALLACFTLVAMFSIGVFVLPVTACLVTACIMHVRPQPQG